MYIRHTYTYTYIHTFVRTYIPAYIHTHIRTYIRTYVRTYIHTYMHAYMCMYVRYCTHMHITFMTVTHNIHDWTSVNVYVHTGLDHVPTY